VSGEQRPLTPAQLRTAKALPWYRAWLLSTGRTEEELGDDQAEERDP
jgi:hypothetical protein